MRSSVPFALLCLLTACPHGGPPGAPRGGERTSRELVLETDPLAVDRVLLVGELPGSPRAVTRTGPGRWAVRVDGLTPGRLYRYRFRVHRKDLKRWIEVSDPRAWLWDASSRRSSLLRGGRSLAPAPGRTRFRAPPLRDLIIYELCPREVVPPDTPYAHPSRDPDSRGPGRVFRRITERLRAGYYRRLGVNALELMPVMASAWTGHGRPRPERDPWGYLPLSWYALNGDYGSPEDLAALVREAHRQGIAVLLDFSLDHGYGGTRHGLLTDLHPSWRKPAPENPWGLLELELTRPDARRFLVGALRRLLLRYGIDGFRMDWTEKVPWQTWARVTRAIREIRPDAVLISENPVVDHVARAGFDGTWDFFFHWEAPLLLRQVYQSWDGVNRQRVSTQRKLVENLTTWARGPHAPPGPLVRYIESHDLPRIARPRVRWQHGGDALMDVDGDGEVPDWLDGGGPVASRLGAALLFTVPGAPMIFAGQELGADDDLVWRYDPVRDRPRGGAADLPRLYSRLAWLRRRRPSLRSDDLRVLLDDDPRHLLVYSRGTDPDREEDDDTVVALNFGSSHQSVTLGLAGEWRDPLGGRVYRGPPLTLELAPRGALLLTRNDDRVATPAAAALE